MHYASWTADEALHGTPCHGPDRGYVSWGVVKKGPHIGPRVEVMLTGPGASITKGFLLRANLLANKFRLANKAGQAACSLQGSHPSVKCGDT